MSSDFYAQHHQSRVSFHGPQQFHFNLFFFLFLCFTSTNVWWFFLWSHFIILIIITKERRRKKMYENGNWSKNIKGNRDTKREVGPRRSQKNKQCLFIIIHTIIVKIIFYLVFESTLTNSEILMFCICIFKTRQWTFGFIFSSWSPAHRHFTRLEVLHA